MPIDLKFTICFIIKDNDVLLLRRNKKPWLDHWNGVGGKLEPGEKPKDGIYREVLEETGIDLKQANETKFTGIVTWSTNKTIGMYAFIASLSDEQKIWHEERKTEEGVLAWKPLTWALDKHNPDIAQNIPHFLPEMLKREKPMEYFCHFNEEGEFTRVEILEGED